MTTQGPPIREWARANGFHIAAKGRIAPAIHKAYRDAHGEPERPPNAAHCKSCGRTWTSAAECHCTTCHRQFASVRSFDDHWHNAKGRQCNNPLFLTTADGRAKYKMSANAWGDLVVRADEIPRPTRDDEDDEHELVLM